MPNSAAAISLCSRFWPGLHLLWIKGDVHSLLVSVLFAWFIALAWTATFVWPEWLTTIAGREWIARVLLVVVWGAIVGSSLYSAIRTTVDNSSVRRPNHGNESNFKLAQEYYLQANYFEAERLLQKNLGNTLDDIESAILRVAILRRTKRISQALELISEITLLDAAGPWGLELHVEKEKCLQEKHRLPPAHS
jgi:hypothetical protein